MKSKDNQPKDQSNNPSKKQDNGLDTPLKRGFDKVYQMILVNGLFVLLNMHILLGFIFIKPGNIVLFYVILGLSSFNVIPSYVALTKTLRLPAHEEQKVVKDYFKMFVKTFKFSFVMGLLGITVMVNLLTWSIFFAIQSMIGLAWFFQGIFFLALAITIALSHLGGIIEETIWKTIKLGFKNLISLLPGAASFVVIAIMAIGLGGVFRVLLIIGFSLGAMIQEKLSDKGIERIKSGYR